MGIKPSLVFPTPLALVDGQFPHVFYTTQAVLGALLQTHQVEWVTVEQTWREESEMNKIWVGTVSDMSKAPASRKLAGGRGEVSYQTESTKSKKTQVVRLEQWRKLTWWFCINVSNLSLVVSTRFTMSNNSNCNFLCCLAGQLGSRANKLQTWISFVNRKSHYVEGTQIWEGHKM